MKQAIKQAIKVSITVLILGLLALDVVVTHGLVFMLTLIFVTTIALVAMIYLGVSGLYDYAERKLSK